MGDTQSDDGRIVRLTSTGGADTSFDGDGLLVNTQSTCVDIAVQPNGKIVTLGGHHSPDGDRQYALHRYNSDGSLDPTFKGDGSAYPNFDGDDSGRCLVLYPDGRILAAGIEVFFGVNCPLIRLMPDGSADVGGRQWGSFSSERFPTASLEFTSSMGVQPNGRIVVAGSIMNSQASQIDVALSRYLPNGALDMTFGVQGHLTFDVQNDDAGQSMAIQPDGKIVVAGYTGSPNTQFLIARFTSDGVPDPTFGNGGYVTRDFAGGADYAHAVAIAPDGKIVVAGTVTAGGNTYIGVARYFGSGFPDETLAQNGYFMYAIPGAVGLSGKLCSCSPISRSWSAARRTATSLSYASTKAGLWTRRSASGARATR
jgi:uncharacterized delta-60 repeat protein